MEINDIFGVGKILPIDKLFNIVSSSVGKISKPYFDRKDIDTKAYEIKKIAEARAEEMNIIAEAVKKNFLSTGGIEYKDEKVTVISPKENDPLLLNVPSLNERVEERQNFQEQKKQLNIESITAIAAEELKNEEPIVDEPLDEDWTTRFFKICEEISNEEMQILWGKILAGEIKNPKSFSLRSLEIIRNLSSYEAQIFTKIANLAIRDSNSNYIFKGDETNKTLKRFGITFDDIELMKEIGLIQPNDFITHQIYERPNDTNSIYTSGNILIHVFKKSNTRTIDIPIYIFTNTGNEILKLTKTNSVMDYLSLFANYIADQNAEVKYGYIISIENGMVRYTQPLQNFKKIDS